MASHFKACHDTSNLGDKKIKRCTINGCSAYFLKRWQLHWHRKTEHSIQAKKPINPKSDSLQCSLCFIKFSKLGTLQSHQRQQHRYQLQNNQTLTSVQVTDETVVTTQFKCNFCTEVKDNPY